MTHISHIEGSHEIDQPNVEGVRLYQDIMRLDATMNDSGLMNIVQALGQLARDPEEILQTDLFLCLGPCIEGHSLEIVLGYEPDVPLGFEGQGCDHKRIM
ncbi:MAG: hypothetical protein KJ808_04445 [Acidobacteria bacterium]|nr:hypothetical protein [Acidobacteriota bacterium]